jgi:hypothetical protein
LITGRPRSDRACPLPGAISQPRADGPARGM